LSLAPTPDHDAIRASDGVIRRLRALHPTLIDLSTGRVERLLEALGRPQDRMAPVIHVAGTNGKGSTTAFLRAMAEAAGLKVHALTSPHLVRFAERIRLAGRLIDDDELERRIGEVERANGGAPISFFEITTALAFHAFAETPADLCLVEVGLGGRFDATNVFAAPAVSVVTPVDYDHLEMLGPELSKIAWEKAGIIKPGRPAVVARQRPEALEVIEAEAARVGAPVTLMGRDIEAFAECGRLAVQIGERRLDLTQPALFGEHQIGNAGLAVAALLALGDPRVTEDAMSAGLSRAVWPARFQRLDRGPLARLAGPADLWLDGAHNPHGAAALARACGELSARDSRPVVLIVGMLGRKDARGYFDALKDLGPRIFATGFSSPNAAPPESLVEAARAAGLSASAVDGVEAAIVEAMAAKRPTPHIVLCGSLHFAGDILALDPATWPV
jgi:dihydrofolate synthase/folylpolyglutamate synthase